MRMSCKVQILTHINKKLYMSFLSEVVLAPSLDFLFVAGVLVSIKVRSKAKTAAGNTGA